MRQSQTLAGLGFSGPQAFSWRLWLIATVGPQLLLFVFGNYVDIQAVLLALVSAVIVSAPFILWLGPLALRYAHGSQSRAWLILSIYIAASCAIATTIGAVLLREPDLPTLVSGAIFHTWFFLLVSEVLNDRVEFIHHMHRLETVRAQLNQVITWRETNLISAKKTEIARIGKQLDIARDRIAAALETGEGVQGLNNEVIRSLLVEMNQESTLFSAQSADPLAVTAHRRTLKRVLTRALSPQTDIAIPSAAFFATTWVVTGLSMSSWQVSILAPLVGGAMLWIVLTFLSRIRQRLAGNAPRILTLVITAVQWFIASALAGIAPVLVAKLPLATLIPIGVQTTFIIFVIAVTVAYRDLGIELSADIAAENEQLERELVENNTVLRALRARLRRFVHGDLQNVLVAAERKLPTLAATQSSYDQSIADSITRALEGLEEFIATEATAPTPQDTIRDLRMMWQGTLAIEFFETDHATQRIEQNNVTSSVVSEVLMEIVTNTAKHDQATRATIQIDLAENDILLLTMTSHGMTSEPLVVAGRHGRPAGPSAQGGQGSRLFDEVCLSWSLTHSDGRTTFTASIPLISAPQMRPIGRAL